jgi:hypothetical protein
MEIQAGGANTSFISRTAAAHSQFQFISDVGGSQTTRMIINQSGNVGIGTDSPAQQLDILYPSYIGKDTVQGLLRLTGQSNTENGAGVLSAGVALEFYNKWTGGAAYSMGRISGRGEQGYDGGLQFDVGTNTQPGQNGFTTAMTINADAYVGIGTTSPTKSLTVNAGSTSGGGINITGSSSPAIYIDETSGVVNSSFQNDGAGSYLGTSTSHPMIFRTNNTERMRITSGGDVLVQATSLGGNGLSIRPNATAGTVQQVFNRASTTSDSYIFDFQNGGTTVGYIRYNNTTTTYATSSDYRLKENVVEMTGALDRVSQLKPSRFNFIADADKTVDGFLAHEVQDIVPEAITGEKDAVDEEGNPKYQGIDQSKLVPLLVGAIQELKAEIELLKTQINN